MIAMGAGTNHWFHSDQIYRTFLALVLMCGCEGRNGGGWAHYVGQEKVRPLTGLADARVRARLGAAAAPPVGDAVLLPRHRSVALRAASAPTTSPRRSGAGCFEGKPHRRPERARRPAGLAAVVSELRPQPARPGRRGRAGRARPGRARRRASCARAGCGFACEDPDAPENHPARDDGLAREPARARRARGTSTSSSTCSASTDHGGARRGVRRRSCGPRDVAWRDQAPDGKLDLLTTIDFRMTSNALFSDVVLPAATWYEKYDLSSTDLHPFVHTFNQAIPPPWEAKYRLGRVPDGSPRASRSWPRRHLGVRRDLVAAPLLHDTPDEIAQPLGEVRDWRAGECEPVPGQDDAEADRGRARLPATSPSAGAALGPLLEKLGAHDQGRRVEAARGGASGWAAQNGLVRGGVADGRPSLERVEHACEAILALSGTTNGRLALEGFRSLERATGVPLADPGRAARRRPDHLRRRPGAAAHGDHLARVVGHRGARPPLRAVHDQRRARQAVAHALGPPALLPRPRVDARARRGAAGFRPPLHHRGDLRRPGRAAATAPELTLRYLTPHSKWSIHSEYQDNLHMLTLFRGGGDAVDQPRGRRGARRSRQRLGRGLQPQRRRRLPGDGLAPDPRGHCLMYHAKDRHLNVPLTELLGQPRRHRQLADADRDEADALHRRLRAALASASTTTARPARSATRSPWCASARRRWSSDDGSARRWRWS